MARQFRHHRPGGGHLIQALYIGRSRCGLTLKELGRYAGMNIRAVSQAAKRIEARLKREKELSKTYRKTLKILGETKV